MTLVQYQEAILVASLEQLEAWFAKPKYEGETHAFVALEDETGSRYPLCWLEFHEEFGLVVSNGSGYKQIPNGTAANYYQMAQEIAADFNTVKSGPDPDAWIF